MPMTDADLTTALIAAADGVLAVEDVTDGVAPGNSFRLRGRLLAPPDRAYNLLADRMRPLGRTPLLRKSLDGDRAEVLALPLTFSHARPRPGLALIFFGLTVLSCLFVGAQMWEWVTASGDVNLNLLDGLPFAASLLVVLLCHEFGHYLIARRLGGSTSLPYFIPMPFGPFGTLGAFIRMAVPPRNRRHLLAVGAAGPLAGLIAAIPLLWLGLSLSHVQPLPPGGYQMEGNSLLYAAMKFLMFGKLLPSGSEDVFIHPVAFAAWAGLLVTGLNLIPAGQLDGGHIVYALLGPRGARVVTWVVMAGLAGLSFLWPGWLLWLGLVFLFGRMQDMPLDELTGLTARQKLFAGAMILVFALVFTPIPLTIVP
jgi:membrane-associated protease RseP (regulator of RpoE activity)